LGGSNTGDNSFAPVISDNAAEVTSFTKNGGGKWIVTGANTYTGASLITGGTLLVNGSTGAGATTVNTNAFLGGNGTTSAVTLNTNSGLAAKISNWTGTAGIGFDDLGVASLNAGNFPTNLKISTAGLTNFSEVTKSFTILNASGSITNFNPAAVTITATDFPGTGAWAVAQNLNSLVLTYTAGGPPSSAYDTFASVIPNAADRDPTDDPDADGISNLAEFVLGGNPIVSSQSILPTQVIDATNIVLSYKRTDASEEAPATTSVGQFSTDLVNWTNVTPALLNENGAAADDMTVTVPKSNAVNGKLFVRVRFVR